MTVKLPRQQLFYKLVSQILDAKCRRCLNTGCFFASFYGIFTPPERSCPAVVRWPKHWRDTWPNLRRRRGGSSKSDRVPALLRGTLFSALQPLDRLDLVELNESFVRRLEQRFQTDPHFQSAADRSRILHCPVEELPSESKYDLIISGLPLNNFSVELVEKILQVLLNLLAPGGTLSFFEYIAMRRAKTIISGSSERQRLRGIHRVMHNVLKIT